ncbi:MAG TPA: putative toxin-antitoxin system toxin component, PIN family [Dehalococcoidia bacterium]|nr:putative toxin-antitoxin system toxin component, PIN family [Dehalococcoidia bacterium]
MRAVFDTNVLVSAILSDVAPPAQIVAGWEAGKFQLVTSDDLFEELRGVLSRPRLLRRIHDDSTYLSVLLARLRRYAIFVLPRERLEVVRDEADKRVLEAAVAGEADYIVTGDKDLLDLGSYQSIEIVTPARFAAILAAENL